jgi:hypothetical protein
MLRKGLLWLLGAAVAAFLCGGPAAAFKSGNWQGDANNDDNGKFRDCTMLAEYNSGITLAFIITRDFVWGLALSNEQWNLEVGSTQDVSLAIDQRRPITSVAKAVDAKGLLIPLENTGPVVDAMRHGRMLTIVTESGKVSFQLSGTRNAISLLAGCVSDHIEQEKAENPNSAFAGLQSKPAAPSGGGDTPAPQQNQNRLFTSSEAAVFASNLLAAAGITGYQLMDPAKNQMPNFDVVWTYQNGIMGAIAAYKDMGSVDLDEAASVVMADDSKSCKGDFASGKKQSAPTDTIGVKRLFTACRTDGSQSLEIHYTLLKTESGHLIQIAHIKIGDNQGDVADADNAFLQTAVLQNFK